MKKSLFLFGFMVLFLTSCDSKATNIADCTRKMNDFEEKIEASDSLSMTISMGMYIGDEELLNMEMSFNMIDDPLYVEVFADGTEYYLTVVDEYTYTIERRDGKYIASYIGGSNEIDDILNLDTATNIGIEDIESMNIKKIDGGYNVTYDLVDYLENSEDDTITDLIGAIDTEMLTEATISMDFIFASDSMKINYICDMTAEYGEESSNVKIDMAIDLSLAKIEPVVTDYWLELEPFAISVSESRILDVTGHTKFYVPNYLKGAVKMDLEDGVYSFNCDTPNFKYTVYDSNLNKIKEANNYSLKKGTYYVYFENLDNSYIELEKQ